MPIAMRSTIGRVLYWASPPQILDAVIGPDSIAVSRLRAGERLRPEECLAHEPVDLSMAVSTLSSQTQTD
jgi:hypothetical protein